MANQRTPLRPAGDTSAPSGFPTLITALTSPGDVVHVTQQDLAEEVHLWALPAGQSGLVTLEVTGPPLLITTVLVNSGPVKLLDGVVFQGAFTLRAFTVAPSVASVFGYTVRNTAKRPLQASPQQPGTGLPVLLTPTSQTLHTLQQGLLDELHLWLHNFDNNSSFPVTVSIDGSLLMTDFVQPNSTLKVIDGVVFRGPGSLTAFAPNSSILAYGYFLRR
jgi:hypothetical protein